MAETSQIIVCFIRKYDKTFEWLSLLPSTRMESVHIIYIKLHMYKYPIKDINLAENDVLMFLIAN